MDGEDDQGCEQGGKMVDLLKTKEPEKILANRGLYRRMRCRNAGIAAWDQALSCMLQPRPGPNGVGQVHRAVTLYVHTDDDHGRKGKRTAVLRTCSPLYWAYPL